MKKIPRQTSSHVCKCGYVFAVEKPSKERSFDSFAVIRDKEYKRFLKSEMAVLESTSKEAKLKAIATSSGYVGSIMECPDCGRFRFTVPGGKSSVITYIRENA